MRPIRGFLVMGQLTSLGVELDENRNADMRKHHTGDDDVGLVSLAAAG